MIVKKRRFALVTYISDIAAIMAILSANSRKIRSYAAICHDKDETDAHYHIVIRTFNAFTAKQVADWFNGNSFSGGQNTFAQFVEDAQGIIDYLTHVNNPDKYQYSRDAIIDGGLDDLLPREDYIDNSYEIVADILAGFSIDILLRRYGRELVYHYQQYKTIAERILAEDGQGKQSINPAAAPVCLTPDYTK